MKKTAAALAALLALTACAFEQAPNEAAPPSSSPPSDIVLDTAAEGACGKLDEAIELRNSGDSWDEIDAATAEIEAKTLALESSVEELKGIVLDSPEGEDIDESTARMRDWCVENAGSMEVSSAGASEEAVSHDGAQELISELGEADISCTGYEPVEGAVGAETRGSCYLESGEEVVVSTYASADDVDVQMETHRALGGEVHLLTGPDWTLNSADGGFLEAAQEVLGGTLVME
ncbi:hypothetical protein HDA32_002307 [Spinactinospora alkalitolerans]|uniref:Uncharacterized protein n=1 Tax=Spinactinospora alkalitolerans TaxID=687207 RepID=A0A852TV71_9ACTN|nr:hypothetical protein [Spinactinospora alkalitolerans]NYE47187.1 hypothetical protein [Spinactinospora alkalitolerans]